MDIEDLAHIAFVLGLVAAVFFVNMQIDMALVAITTTQNRRERRRARSCFVAPASSLSIAPRIAP